MITAATAVETAAAVTAATMAAAAMNLRRQRIRSEFRGWRRAGIDQRYRIRGRRWRDQNRQKRGDRKAQSA
jgi:hypothetical protein